MIRTATALAATCLLLSGCGRDRTDTPRMAEPIYSKQYREDSVTVIESASETNIAVSDRIHLALEVHAPSGEEAVLPHVESQPGSFSVLDSYTEPTRGLPNGKNLSRTVWTIAPDLPGELVLQSMEISVGSVTVHTEPLTIAVTSMLPSNLDSLEIRDIAPAIELLPQQQENRRLWLVAGILAMGVVSALLIGKARRVKVLEVRPPWETALAALDSLPEEPVEKIHVLARILKTYLEQRYQLPVSGKTLAETLPLLSEEQREELADFMRTSEDIRFSNKVPEGFVDEALSLVRNFMERTREVSCD